MDMFQVTRLQWLASGMQSDSSNSLQDLRTFLLLNKSIQSTNLVSGRTFCLPEVVWSMKDKNKRTVQ